VGAAVAADSEVPAEPVVETDAPYVGLAPFRIGDAARFHGRDALLAELREQVATRRFGGVTAVTTRSCVRRS